MDNKWVILYIERWLKAQMQLPDGSVVAAQNRDTPQGGVISPLLSNILLNYAFDVWMNRKYGAVSWCRYADD